jgi:hypothetical protein
MYHTYRSLGKTLELHNIRGKYSTTIALDGVKVLVDHPETISVEDDVHALLPGNANRKLGIVLHVGFTAETWADDEDMQAGE